MTFRPGVLCALLSLLLVASSGWAQVDIQWEKGEMLAAEDFGQGLGGWLAEGDVDARVEDGRLRFEATETSDVKKGNIWWKRKFDGPLRVEFDYRSATVEGLTMFWFMADGRDGADLLEQKRSGDYLEYVQGEMNGYHVSFHRFGSGVCNLRKSCGFHLLASAPDPIPAEDLELHRIAVSLLGSRIVVEVDGRVVHDFVDQGAPCTAGAEWVHADPCPGTGPVLNRGYLGVRHTQKQAAWYDNFKVWRMKRRES